MVAAIGLAASITAAAELEPWPRWRGPDGAGQGGGARFPVEWTESDWAWTASLPGTGNASPNYRAL